MLQPQTSSWSPKLSASPLRACSTRCWRSPPATCGPLPHQIRAVYGELLPRTPLRFLLADDPGAGKTIMAGLYIKELILRDDVKQCLIVAPGGLVEQWQDELYFKFGLRFDLLTNQLIDANVNLNVFDTNPLLIARMDQLSRNEDLQAQLAETEWDLIIVDEAHRMGAHYFGGKLEKTKRFQLGELLGGITRHLLLMTATPHSGKEEDFQLFLWTKLVQGKDAKSGAPATKTYDPLDPQTQFRMLTEANITAGYKPKWYPFNQALGRAGESFAIELREVRNKWAHHTSTFTDDDAYRALDTGERLLRLIGAASEADEVRNIRLNLRRMTADKDDKKVLKAAVDNPEAAGLKPWREVLAPHDDVATGNFAASEFAADLHRVAFGGEQDSGYAKPVEFFQRTYLTEGLTDLIARAVRRLSGDDNAPPVINLQTNFGGGKTHSMLALWHVACGLPLGEFPQETQDLLSANGYTGAKVNRVAIVGNHVSPSGVVKDDGTHVNTVWGELAWQLGGPEAYALVANADANRTPPRRCAQRAVG